MPHLARLLKSVNSPESRLLARPIRRQIPATPRRLACTGFFPNQQAVQFGFPLDSASYATHATPRAPRAMATSGTHAADSAAWAPDDLPPAAGPMTDPNAAAGIENPDAGDGDDGSSADALPERSAEEWRLPEELWKGLVHLQCDSSAEGGICDVYLVGTAHVSKESCREVEAVINQLKPQVVFLELCASRVAVLSPRDLEVPSMSDMIDMWRKKKMNSFGILYSWFLAKVADKLEVLPGSEFRVAYEAARSYGAKVILGDRPVHITLRRTWGRMSLWHRAKFIYYLLFQALFLPSPDDINKMLKDMNEEDMLTSVVQEMSTTFPTLMETLLHERDLYMSSTLHKVASEHNSVVAVVGKGHLAGIMEHWKQPVDMKALIEMPERGSGVSPLRIMTSVGMAAAGVAIVYGIYVAGKK